MPKPHARWASICPTRLCARTARRSRRSVKSALEGAARTSCSPQTPHAHHTAPASLAHRALVSAPGSFFNETVRPPHPARAQRRQAARASSRESGPTEISRPSERRGLQIDKLPRTHHAILKSSGIREHDYAAVLLFGQRENAHRSVLGHFALSADRWLATDRATTGDRPHVHLRLHQHVPVFPQILPELRVRGFSSPACSWA